MQAQPSKAPRRRHVPTNVSNIYWSGWPNNKKFECRYTNSEGRRVYEVCGSFEQAKKRLAEVTGKLATGETTGDISTTVGTLIDGWLALRDSKASSRRIESRNVRLYLRPRWGRVKARDVSKVAIQEWLLNLKKQDGTPMSGGTARLILAHFSGIMEHGVDTGVISINPVKALKRKPSSKPLPARILGPGELDVLLAASPDWLGDIIVVTLNQGLRLGEVVGLDWKDVDWDNDMLTIERQLYPDGTLGTPKGNKTCVIDLMPEARRVLARLWMAAGRPADGPVLRTSTGGHRWPKVVQRSYVAARRRAGLSEEPRALRFHDLRHTAISRLANRPGAIFPAIQAFARHANLAQTLAYVHGDENATWAAEAALALAEA